MGFITILKTSSVLCPMSCRQLRKESGPRLKGPQLNTWAQNMLLIRCNGGNRDDEITIGWVGLGPWFTLMLHFSGLWFQTGHLEPGCP